ncbi:MAG: farnesyl-diphosphate synthase [Proteobacteria bacterium]|nr:MAG: farnesyl-diphosphate synthase [Pseudomonadota bacterium]
MKTIKQYLAERKKTVEDALQEYIPKAEGAFRDHMAAMRYSLFVGGKRIRPILCLAAAEALNSSPSQRSLLLIGCALECIHTYSLIHDDLPAMDNDDLRRGKPTNHKVYGEAAAILAGDGLLTYSFELLAHPDITLPPADRLRICSLIARAAGPTGMVGGQSLDIANENKRYPFELLQTIHRSKTGALITCSVQVGAIAGGASPEQEKCFIEYGKNIGLAFQIVDDLLDATSTTEQLGKTVGSDEQKGKATYPGYFGIEKTRKKAQQAIETAQNAIRDFDQKADPLRALADYIYFRSH